MQAKNAGFRGWTLRRIQLNLYAHWKKPSSDEQPGPPLSQSLVAMVNTADGQDHHPLMMLLTQYRAVDSAALAKQ